MDRKSLSLSEQIMKQDDYQGIEVHPQKDSALFTKVFDLLESDLTDRRLELSARATLVRVRKRGYDIVKCDLDYPECLLCLYTALECVQHLAFEPGEDFEPDHLHSELSS